jgi:hypothetical protein
LYYKELAEAALATGISVPNLTGIPVLEELGRSKFEENFNDLLPKLRKRIQDEIAGLKED